MIRSKKAELEEIILTVTILLGVFLVLVWYLLFVSEQTVAKQDLHFKTLNTFSSYYGSVLKSTSMNVSGIEINANEGSKIILEGNVVCIELENLPRVCQSLIQDSTSYNNSFELETNNFFTFIKDENGNIEINYQ